MTKDKISYKSINEIPQSKWEELSKKTFYFAHQSVGFNILDGIKDISKEHPELKISMIDKLNPSSFQPAAIIHSEIGENTKPTTKINEFTEILNNGIGTKIDVAALKFCYIDIVHDTDSKQIFSQYTESIEGIKKSFPNLKIIHFTSPLTTLQSGLKAWIKAKIGRRVEGMAENINRHEYNELIREKYQKTEPILDIARIESTKPDGTRSTFMENGKEYFSLARQYTDDGGHLNKLGRIKVAEQLILLLANM